MYVIKTDVTLFLFFVEMRYYAKAYVARCVSPFIKLYERTLFDQVRNSYVYGAGTHRTNTGGLLLNKMGRHHLAIPTGVTGRRF